MSVVPDKDGIPQYLFIQSADWAQNLVSSTCNVQGFFHTVGDGGIYPRHEFDMGGGDIPHQLFFFFLVPTNFFLAETLNVLKLP
jgi:hypothetical protein